MTLGILGLGSAGTRHYENAQSLGLIPMCYDPAGSNYSREEVLDQSDAVIVASPSDCHLADLDDCIAEGKHVLVEKPIGLVGQGDRVRRLLAKAKKQNTIVATGFNLRFHPATRDLKKSLTNTTPYYASFICCQATEKEATLRNGVINDWIVHELDLAQYLLGPLRLRSKYTAERQVDLMLIEPSTHCHVHIHSDMRANHRIRRVIVAAEDASWDIDLEDDPVTDEHYKLELQRFLERVSGKPGDSLATGEDGLSVLRVCEQVGQ